MRPPTLPGSLLHLQRYSPGQRRVPLQLGLDVESHQAQPLLRGRQQLAPEPRSAPGHRRQRHRLEEQSVPGQRSGLQPESAQSQLQRRRPFSWGGPANNGSENTIYSYNDDFTLVKGAHTFKAGGALQVSHYNGFGRQCISGCATFSYINTGVPGGNNPQLRADPLSRPCCWATPTEAPSTRSDSSASSGPPFPATFRTTGMSAAS